jgi:hypothetical protein
MLNGITLNSYNKCYPAFRDLKQEDEHVKDSSLCDHHFKRKSICHWYVIFSESNAQSFRLLIATFRTSWMISIVWAQRLWRLT